jgi:hypothetical protein
MHTIQFETPWGTRRLQAELEDDTPLAYVLRTFISRHTDAEVTIPCDASINIYYVVNERQRALDLRQTLRDQRVPADASLRVVLFPRELASAPDAHTNAERYQPISVSSMNRLAVNRPPAIGVASLAVRSRSTNLRPASSSLMAVRSSSQDIEAWGRLRSSIGS